MSFLAGSFLFALAAVAGPFLIHLLNRRRHRTIEWAAMNFLREAIRRNKRLVELRDLLLLAVRTLAVLLFVLAMARPYWVTDGAGSFQGQPIHAVLVVDNSLSMGYTQLDKSLLDVAREKAKAFIKELPKGSDVSIIPLCNLDEWHVRSVYSTQEDALEALDRIALVDRAARASVGAERARRACQEASEIPTKRVVFFGDMQQETWASSELPQYFESLGDVQSVQIGPQQRENTSVAEFRLRDGAADIHSPAVLLATIRHTGAEPRERVRVTLKIGSMIAEERFVDLLPEQNLQLVFKHKFDVAGSANEPLFVAARLEISPDHLAEDDFRTCIVPVVGEIPVLCIDQYGEDEDLSKNRFGETYPLRRLLAPSGADSDYRERLIKIRHRRIDQVTRDDLKDARLVLIAGTRSPSPELVGDLRQYVQQGGQLLIAAGGQFDPLRWNDVAWREGAGILPAPLRDRAVGDLPSEPGIDVPTFHLATNTFNDEPFVIGLDPREQEALLRLPFFYKAVGVDESALVGLEALDRARLKKRIDAKVEYEAAERVWAEKERRGDLSADEQSRREAARLAIEANEPNWLGWADPLRPSTADLTLDQQVARGTPRVMGRFDNGEVFAIRRSIGEGEVVMMTSGCYPEWNNVATETSVLIFDQLMRGLLAHALPERTLTAVNEVVIPLSDRDQAAEFTLSGPHDSEPQPIPVEATGENTYGIVLRSLADRGTYTIRRLPAEEESPDSAWTISLACNGPADESELAALDKATFDDRFESKNVRWLDAGDAISLEGETYLGHNVWKVLMMGVLACLLIEMFLLSPKSTRRKGKAGALSKSERRSSRARQEAAA